MNKIFSLLLAMLTYIGITTSTNAQVSTYNFASTSGTYVPITGGTVISSPIGGTDNDTDYPPVAIGFPFTYNGVAYTNVGVSPNGSIFFGASSGTGNSNGINQFNPFRADLRQRALPSDVRVQTIGISPNRTCVIQYNNWGRFAFPSDIYNFQAILTETANAISVVYGSIITTSTSADMKIVGLGGNSSSDYNRIFIV